MALSKRDALMVTLAGLGFSSGSVSDRLYAYEQSVYNESDPDEPISLSDYLTYGTVSAFNKYTIQ